MLCHQPHRLRLRLCQNCQILPILGNSMAYGLWRPSKQMKDLLLVLPTLKNSMAHGLWGPGKQMKDLLLVLPTLKNSMAHGLWGPGKQMKTCSSTCTKAAACSPCLETRHLMACSIQATRCKTRSSTCPKAFASSPHTNASSPC